MINNTKYVLVYICLFFAVIFICFKYLSQISAIEKIYDFQIDQDPVISFEIPTPKNLLDFFKNRNKNIEVTLYSNNHQPINFHHELIIQKRKIKVVVKAESLSIPGTYFLKIKNNYFKQEKSFTWGLESEILNKRTATSKTFKIADGNLRSVFSTKNIHYQDESNQLQDINTVLIKSKDENYLYENTSNLFKSYFGNLSSGKPFTKFIIDDCSIDSGLGQNQSLGDLNFNAEIKIHNNQLIYKNVYPDIDLRYILSSEKVLEEFILNKYRPVDRIDQFLKIDGLNYRLNQDQTIDLIDKKTGKIIVKIPKPVMYEITSMDNGGQRKKSSENYGLKYEIKRINHNTISVSKVLNKEGIKWLLDPNRNYPLVIDTVDNFNITASGDDGYLQKYGSNRKLATAWSDALSSTPYVNQNLGLTVARYCTAGYACYINRSYLRWDTSSVPDDNVVNSVIFRPYLTAVYIDTHFNIEIKGNAGTTCWGTTLDSGDFGCGATIFGVYNTSSLPAINNTFDIGVSSASINKTGYTEYELRHYDDDRATAPTEVNADVFFEDFEEGSGHEPILIVDHSSSTINLSGTVYTNEGSINIGSNKTVNLRIGGSGTYTAETNSSGFWTINNITAVSGDIITAYLNDETEKATTVMISNGVGITNVDLYVNRLIVRQDIGATISNATLAAGDDSDPDVKYSVSSNNLTVDPNMELHVWTGDTYDPGGFVVTNTSGGIFHMDDNSWAYLGLGSTIGIGITADNGTQLTFNNNYTVVYSGITNIGSASITNSPPSTVIILNSGTLGGSNATIAFDNLSLGGSGTTLVNAPLLISTLTIGDGTNSRTFDVETNDKTLTIVNLIINSNAVFNASSTANFDLTGNWTNNGVFNSGTGNVNFQGSNSINLDTGCLDDANCSDNDFFNITIIKTLTSATITLIDHPLKVQGTFTITRGKLIQGSYNVRALGTTAVSIGASGTWTNTSSGDLYLGGMFNNSGIATFQGGGVGCGDSDSIIIRGVGVTSNWSGTGTFNFNDVDVQSQAGTANITVYSGTNSGGNGGNWTFESCPTTSTMSTSTAYSFQRKTFYDNINNNYWLFYDSGSGITIKYSTNSVDWILATSPAPSTFTNDFSIWHTSGSSYVYIVYAISNDIYIKRGTLSSSDISWGDEYTVFNGSSDSDSYSYPFITLDSSNYIYVSARHTYAGDQTATYYFNSYNPSEAWTNDPSFMADGSTSTYAYTSTANQVQLLNSNQCTGQNLGTISKIEIRTHGYTAGDDDVYLRPVFNGTADGTNFTYSLPADSGAYSSYYDITLDTNHPNPWTWSDIQNLDLDIQYVKVGGASTNYVSRAEIRVTYSSTTQILKVAKSALTDSPSGTWTTSELSDSANTDPNVYGVIVPLSSQNLYAVWEKGTAIEGKKFNGSIWDASATSIGTGITGLSTSLQAVSDSSNNIHLTYINDSNQTTYRQYTDSWQTPVTLDSNTGNEYPSISLNVGGGNGLYSFWTRDNDIFYRRSCSSYTSWDSPVTFESNGVNKWLSSTYQDYESGKIFTQWTQGSASPYVIKWNSFTPSSCSVNQSPSAPQTPYVNNNNTQTGQTTPVFGLIDHTPAFSAIFDDPDTSDFANYYQLQVNSDSGFGVGTSLWDSGKTSMTNCNENTRCSDVTYNGAALNDGSTYYWRLKFWDNSNAESPWSDTQQFSINNHPVVSNIVVNSGLDIDLSENTSVGVSWTATVTDTDGYSNINGVTAKFFRSGVGGAQDCTPDNNNCYTVESCPTTNCADNSCTATCTANVYFFADPTNIGSTFADQYWRAWIQATDTRTEVGSTLSSLGSPDIKTLAAFNIGSSLTYGQLLPGDDTGSTNPTLLSTNTGNVLINFELTGQNMCLDYPSCTQYIINSDNQQYDLSSFIYGTGTTLSTSPATLNIGLSKPTETPSNSQRSIFWGIGIPLGIENGDYTGQTTILLD